MKTKPEKSPAKMRERIRINEQNRLKHAMEVIRGLLQRHELDSTKWLYDLNMLETQLGHAIKFQHIADPAYAEYKQQQLESPEDF